MLIKKNGERLPYQILPFAIGILVTMEVTKRFIKLHDLFPRSKLHMNVGRRDTFQRPPPLEPYWPY